MRKKTNRRFLISVSIWALGTVCYLLLSRSPGIVRVVTILTQTGFLLTVSWILWEGNWNLRTRMLSLLATVLVASAAATYLDSFVIYSLSPPHPLLFGLGVISFGAEALLLLVCTWTLDRATARLLSRD